MSTNFKLALKRLLVTGLLIAFALILGGLLVRLSGNSVLEAYEAIINGAFGTERKINELFVKLIPLVIMSLGVSVAFRAKLWNIGASGQFIMGAIAGVAVALYVPLPYGLRSVLSFIGALLAGAAWAGISGLLKNHFHANEVITTLMLNYIANCFLLYMINVKGPMHDPSSDLIQSALIPDAMRLTKLVGKYRLHSGLYIMIAVVLLIVLLWRTVYGRRIMLVGEGKSVAAYAGVHRHRTVLETMMISGAIIGAAGWIEMFGIQYRLLDGIAADYGDTATVIALLGSLGVPGILAAAAFFSVLLCGGSSMQRMTNVPYSVVNVMQGLIIVLVSARERLVKLLPDIFGKVRKHTDA